MEVMCWWLLCLLLTTISHSNSQYIEIRGPNELSDLVLEDFRLRTGNHDVQTVAGDSHTMETAQTYIEKRLQGRKSDAEQVIRGLSYRPEEEYDEVIASGLVTSGLETCLTHKASETISAAINSNGALFTSPQPSYATEALAQAFSFSGKVGLGPVAQAGALPQGGRGEWMTYAERKVQRDTSSLSDESMVWEMGLALVEKEKEKGTPPTSSPSIVRGKEDSNGDKQGKESRRTAQALRDWVEAEGGHFRSVQPSSSSSSSSSSSAPADNDADDLDANRGLLTATEAVHAGDVVMSLPLRMLMCKHTARHALLQGGRGSDRRGSSGDSGGVGPRSLDKELKRAFAENEEWGLALLLLHEYYQWQQHSSSSANTTADQSAQLSSQWSPLLQTLTARLLTSETMQELSGTRALDLHAAWLAETDRLHEWAHGINGPCHKAAPKDQVLLCEHTLQQPGPPPATDGGVFSRSFSLVQIRWALWVVKQHAVWVTTDAAIDAAASHNDHSNSSDSDSDSAVGSEGGGGRGGAITTAMSSSSFLALVPYAHYACGGTEMIDGRACFVLEGGAGIATVRAAHAAAAGETVCSSSVVIVDDSKAAATSAAASGGRAGEVASDAEWIMRGQTLPFQQHTCASASASASANPYTRPGTVLPWSPPGAVPDTLPRTSTHGTTRCTSGQRRRRMECGYQWRQQALGQWRRQLKLPPRAQELRASGILLGLFSPSEVIAEAESRGGKTVQLILPVTSTHALSSQEQLMFLGAVSTVHDAHVMTGGAESGYFSPRLHSVVEPVAGTPNYEVKVALLERAREELAYLAAQTQSAFLHSHSVDNDERSGGSNTEKSATVATLAQAEAFFARGDLPIAGLDPLDEYLLKKLDIMTACGPASSMYFTLEGAPSDGLLCAMRVHLMGDPELGVFCPEEAHAWEQQCHEVLLDPSMAVSESNERAVLQTLSKAVERQLGAYPGSKADDGALLARLRTSGAVNNHTHVAAIQLRHTEKAILEAASAQLQRRLGALKRGEVRYQIDRRKRERRTLQELHIEYDAETERRREQTLAIERDPLSTVEVDMGEAGKHNLTVSRGESLQGRVQAFAKKFQISPDDAKMLEQTLRNQVPQPPPLALLMTVIHPTTLVSLHLAIPERKKSSEGREGGGSSSSSSSSDVAYYTREVAVFCRQHDMRDFQDELLERVLERVMPARFVRSVRLQVPVESIDGRHLLLQVHEGEQHDLYTLVSEFFSYYKLPLDEVSVLVNNAISRLPPVLLKFPVQLPKNKQLVIHFVRGDDEKQVVEAFIAYYGLGAEGALKHNLLSSALKGMNPSAFAPY